MDISQSYIDLLRAVHLVFFAAGMGTALYMDFMSFWSIQLPRSADDMHDLERIHIWITAAFVGLWLSGMSLIYVRTGFELALFSPKLWLKIGVMTLMTLNSGILVIVILPMMRRMLGRCVISLPLFQLMGATQIAVISLFCWSSGLFLGSSVVLKSASWDMLFPLACAWFIILTLGGQASVMFKRAQFRSQSVGLPS